tara:strand:- start:618 stop:1655 length:1038 start_codon:yes stop_codon:yes gene_type:complete
MIEILKSNEKYLIYKDRLKNKTIIKKIALEKNNNLTAEMNRIDFLITNSRKYKSHLVKVLDRGKSNILGMKNRNFYSMNYVKGITFSKLLQSKNILSQVKLNHFNNTFKRLYDLTFELEKFDSSFKKKNWYKRFKKINNKIKNFPIIDSLLKDEYYVNENKIYSYESNMKNIFEKGNSSFNAYGMSHANFHGDNIIFTDLDKKNKFKIIDPDCKALDIDSTFSLARFLYTQIHDTVEYEKYKIELTITGKGMRKFKVFNTWSNFQMKSYSLIELRIKELINQFKYKDCSNRIIKSYLLCLLIGIFANHNGVAIKKRTNKSYSIKSSALYIFLSLQTVINNIMNIK